MHPEAKWVVEHFGLLPLPVEGGWFRQTWKSPESGGAGTAIVVLFADGPDGFSALHRLRAAEVWHFYRGDPFRLVRLHPDGASDDVVLGCDLEAGEEVQVVVPPGVWMGGHVVAGGRYSLLGCTMAPGFTSEGFEAGDRGVLSAAYPDRAGDIALLTR